ncbi:Abi family protein [Secundilactobacillus muriivasis]
MVKKGKSTDALMRHIRDKHHINVSGSSGKQALLDMGYFHGYKAYRIDRHAQSIGLTDFQQVQAVHKFDNRLKALMYPVMMSIETSLKNRTIAIIVRDNSPVIDDVFEKILTRFREENIGSKKYKERMRDRLRLKNRIDALIAERYGSTPMIQHFVHNGDGVPIWAIFELFTMGDFGAFLGVMNRESRVALLNNVDQYDKASDTVADFMVVHVFLLKDLRNAIAHNSIVFDCRFKHMQVRDSIAKQLQQKMKFQSKITFESITDYLALMVYYLCALNTPHREIYRLITEFESAVNDFRQSLNSKSIADMILTTDVFSKIEDLKNAVSIS